MTDLQLHTYGRGVSEARTLVLLHGFSDSGPSWAQAIAHWSDEYRVVAPDARGHGESPRYATEDPYYEVMVDDAVEVLEQVRTESGATALVVGHSMGAAVAAVAAERRPDLVAALVLEDPPWRDPALSEPLQPPAGDGPLAFGVPLSEDELAEHAAEQGRAHPAWPAEELLPWARAKTRTDRRFAQRRSKLPPIAWPTTAAALTVPTLLVTGDGDVLVTEPVRARLAEVAPQVRVAVIPGAGHCVRRDQGERFHDVVDPFLAGAS